jgi:Uma2 family endonuclease
MQVELPDIETYATFDVGPGRPMDDDEFFDFCAQNRHLRIEREANGAITIMPPAGFETGHRNNIIAYQVMAWAMKDGRGVAPDSNTEYFLPGGAALGPDASWVSKERLAAFSKEQKKRFLHLCPDFVIELMSPSDRLSKVQAKMLQWIENGAALGWLLDADRRTAYIYRPGREPEELVNPDHLLGEGPVAGFRLELGDIWRGLD